MLIEFNLERKEISGYPTKKPPLVKKSSKTRGAYSLNTQIPKNFHAFGADFLLFSLSLGVYNTFITLKVDVLAPKNEKFRACGAFFTSKYARRSLKVQTISCRITSVGHRLVRQDC